METITLTNMPTSVCSINATGNATSHNTDKESANSTQCPQPLELRAPELYGDPRGTMSFLTNLIHITSIMPITEMYKPNNAMKMQNNNTISQTFKFSKFFDRMQQW